MSEVYFSSKCYEQKHELRAGVVQGKGIPNKGTVSSTVLPSGRQGGELPGQRLRCPTPLILHDGQVDLCASYSKTQKSHRQLFRWSSLRNSLTVCSLSLNPKSTSASGLRGFLSPLVTSQANGAEVVLVIFFPPS